MDKEISELKAKIVRLRVKVAQGIELLERLLKKYTKAEADNTAKDKRISELKVALEKISHIENEWDGYIPECEVCCKVQTIAEKALNPKDN